MKPLPPLHVAKADALVREAAASHLPVFITWRRLGGGMDTVRASLLDIDENKGGLWITRPVEWNSSAARMPADGRLSVSFNRGLQTCRFDSRIVIEPEQDDGHDQDGGPVKLEWPTEVFEQQRRRYDRVSVPAGCPIPVTVHRVRDGVDTARADPLPCGRMIDLSPGGLSMELPGDRNVEVKAEDRVICAFAASTGGPRLKAWSLVRHGKRTGRGNLRLGLQFLDLDVGLGGQLALKNIVSLTSRFRLM